ncbi:hypothetical protein [Streptomyces acidiscabies]|uniref:Uncharacterized protein n=1 Tax=Streptomyces acidiscabies TaxID=42234 RepID=A0ABU4MC11_9ACTN|nr:hypothetical protein [Streptomyces acidiscabies]MDX3024990.1 hypothetical protein [Streptomyces acidiscabies]
MPTTLAAHWSSARDRSRDLEGLPFGRETEAEHRVLSFVYALIAAETGTGVDRISPWAVRYRLQNAHVLHASLSALLADDAARNEHSGGGPQGEFRDGGLTGGHGQGGGQPGGTQAPGTGSAAGARPPEPDATLAEMLRQTWAALQQPLGIPMEDLLPSNEAWGLGARNPDGVRVFPGPTVFEFAVTRLARIFDQLHLVARHSTPLWTSVLVTDGPYTGRRGTVEDLVWSADDEQQRCREPLAALRVAFEPSAGGTVDLPPTAVTVLPEWDPRYVVVRAGELMPPQWSAAVLLDGSEDDARVREVITALGSGLDRRMRGRLVVLVTGGPDDPATAEEHRQWLRDARTWADEAVALAVPEPADAAFITDGRLVLLAAAPDETTLTWAQERSVPIARTPADAAAMVLERIGAGEEREDGEREVRLPVARTPGYASWRNALRTVGRTVEAATVEWTADLPAGSGDAAGWWALSARLRHPDNRVTEETVVGRSGTISLVAVRKHPVWTESEVVLLSHPVSAVSADTKLSPILAADTFPLRLPSADVLTHAYTGTAEREQAAEQLMTGLGLPFDLQRVRGMGSREESGLLAAHRTVYLVELTDAELRTVRGSSPQSGTVQVHRVSNLLSWASPGSAPCDWATLGVILQSVLGDRHP